MNVGSFTKGAASQSPGWPLHFGGKMPNTPQNSANNMTVIARRPRNNSGQFAGDDFSNVDYGQMIDAQARAANMFTPPINLSLGMPTLQPNAVAAFNGRQEFYPQAPVERDFVNQAAQYVRDINPGYAFGSNQFRANLPNSGLRFGIDPLGSNRSIGVRGRYAF